MLIVQLVIVVIKSHYAAHERMLGVCILRFIIAVKRHHNRLLYEVSRVNNSVRMELLEVFKAPDSVSKSRELLPHGVSDEVVEDFGSPITKKLFRVEILWKK